MNRVQAFARLRQLHETAFQAELNLHGYLPPPHATTWALNFIAGAVMIEPNPCGDHEGHGAYRVWYTSWDGERRRDVTHLSDDEFASFMRAEPRGLIEAD